MSVSRTPERVVEACGLRIASAFPFRFTMLSTDDPAALAQDVDNWLLGTVLAL